MIYIDTGSCLPSINLAFEEYYLKNKDLGDDICMLWQNEPTIVVGRFQNTLQEINQHFTETHNIHIIRRISGGGTVYHDMGNLCFTFILRDIAHGMVNVTKYLQPVLKALALLGVQAEISGRNDLTLDGKKFSGNAMALHNSRLLFHGTLLFDCDLEMLSKVISVPLDEILSKGTPSVRSQVTNIKQHITGEMDVFQFKQTLKKIFSEDIKLIQCDLAAEDYESIQKLSETKYKSWEWNFGRNPYSVIKRSCHFVGGSLEIRLEVEKGLIKSCQIAGNTHEAKINEVEKRLSNIRYIYGDVLAALDGLDLQYVTKDEILACIMGYN